MLQKVEDISDQRTLTIAKTWGWKHPSSQVIAIAKRSLELKLVKSGEGLLLMKVVTREALNQLVKEQPDGVRLLEFAARKDPVIRPLIEQILCLRSGQPYYESFEGLFTVHPLMDDEVVNLACSKLDAVLLLSVERVAVLVFSSNATRLSYNTAGPSARQQDQIRQAVINYDFDGDKQKKLGETEIVLYTALGDRGEVINHLEKSKPNNDSSIEAIPSEFIWIGESASTEPQKILARMIDVCIKNKATDMAITPLRSGISVNRMRRYNDLYKMPTAILKEDEYRAILNFLLVKSGANTTGFRKYIPSDGQMTYRSSSGDVFLRLNFIPMNHPGTSLDMQSISIRFFPRSETDIKLSELNFDPRVAEIISIAARFKQGLILFCGGTNTGKSTAIAAAIGENISHFGDKLKRLSAEQPIERFLKGMTQFNVPEELVVNKKEVEAFQLYLRAFKRHDPDVIWVGEIRDSVTANICVHAANTGHLVFSTIHANDTFLGYDNLSQEVNKDRRYQLVEALSLIVAQDLVQKICEHCSKIGAPTELQIKMFNAACRKHDYKDVKIPEKVRHPSSNGCDKCAETGFVGVLPINEVLECDQEVKDAMLNILGGINVTESKLIIRKARKFTLFGSAMEHVIALRIPLESVVI